MLVAAGTPGIWTLTVLNPTHNHGPIIDRPRQVPHHKVKKGQISAIPYDWPHDATMTPFTTALVVIDMQKDCKWGIVAECSVSADAMRLVCINGGYMEYQGYDISAARAVIPKIQHLLQTFRGAGFPIYHTREGEPKPHRGQTTNP
jgi:Isochorismatase family